VYAFFACPTITKGYETSETLDLLRDVKSGDMSSKARIVELLKKLCVPEGLDPEQTLEYISKETVRIVQRVVGRRRKFNGWSPYIMALEYARESLVLLARHLRATAGHARWGVNEYTRGFADIQQRWRQRTASLGRVPKGPDDAAITADNLLTLAETTRERTMYRNSYAAWEHKSFAEATVEVTDAIRDIKIKMSGRYRTELRRRINSYVRRLEDSRAAGKIGIAIRSYMQSQRVPYALEELIMDGEVLLDQRRIHSAVTSLFSEWFAHDEDSPIGGIGRPSSVWQDLLEPEESFCCRYSSTAVPPDILRTVWRALQPKVSQEE
jgi:hypothetical protein